MDQPNPVNTSNLMLLSTKEFQTEGKTQRGVSYSEKPALIECASLSITTTEDVGEFEESIILSYCSSSIYLQTGNVDDMKITRIGGACIDSLNVILTLFRLEYMSLNFILP